MKQMKLNMKKRNPYAYEVRCIVIRETGAEQKKTRTPEDIYNAWMNSVEHADWFCPDKECMVVFFLTTQNILRGFELVTMGLLDTCLVHPREIFRSAITAGASAIAIAHNHPSGDPTPSAEDVRITRQLIEAGKIIDIEVVDHIIVGAHYDDRPKFTAWTSLRESGLCSF